jgi:hypothetical protein
MTAPGTSELFVSSINLSIPAGWMCTGIGVRPVAHLPHNLHAVVPQGALESELRSAVVADVVEARSAGLT